VCTTIEHVISHVVCELEGVLHSSNADDYVLKVFGVPEYLAGASQLGDYEYIYDCMKIDQDVTLVLVEGQKLQRTLSRTPQDDKNDIPLLPKHIMPSESLQPISYDTLSILLGELCNIHGKSNYERMHNNVRKTCMLIG